VGQKSANRWVKDAVVGQSPVLACQAALYTVKVVAPSSSGGSVGRGSLTVGVGGGTVGGTTVDVGAAVHAVSPSSKSAINTPHNLASSVASYVPPMRDCWVSQRCEWWVHAACGLGPQGDHGSNAAVDVLVAKGLSKDLASPVA
jgi:hypothetical protein